MSILLNAISKGFSANSILNQLKKQIPAYTRAIDTARAAGYTAKSILRQLDGNKHSQGKYLTEREQQIEQDKNKDRKAALGLVSALGVAGAVAGGIGSYLSDRNSTAKSVANIPNNPIPPSGQTTINAQASPLKPSGGVSNAINKITEGQQQIIDKIPSSKDIELIGSSPFKDMIKPSESIKSEFPQLEQFIEKSLKSGKTAEETYDNLKKSRFLSPLVHRIEEKEGKSFLQDIQNRSKSSSFIPAEAPLNHKIGSEVISPFGSGSLEHVKGDKAIINVSGKKRSVSIEEIEPPSEDAIEAVSKILQIPKEKKSSNISLFFYDPEESDLFVQFHTGDFYRYKNIPKEIVEELSEKNAEPLTKGKTVYGEWGNEDKKSLGAALYKYVLKDPRWKKSGKGEPENINYKKLSPLYDYWTGLRKKGKK